MSKMRCLRHALRDDSTLTAIGAAVVVLSGLILGFAAPMSNTNPAPWNRISAIIGWTYFAAWSISFYPQVFLNYRRRSVVGMAFDYQVLNLVGFGSYSVYNVFMHFDPATREHYRARHGGKNPAVELNDVFFAVHAVALTCVTLFQIATYERGSQRVSLFCWSFCGVWAVLTTVYGFGVLALPDKFAILNTLDYIYYLSYVKLAVSLVKYVPQAYLNYSRKSTVGWNIWNVLLDFTGGLLSIVQLMMDAGSTGDWGAAIGNPVKFALGFVSMVFDVVFMTQHYILYTDRTDPFMKLSPADSSRVADARLLDEEEEGSASRR